MRKNYREVKELLYGWNAVIDAGPCTCDLGIRTMGGQDAVSLGGLHWHATSTLGNRYTGKWHAVPQSTGYTRDEAIVSVGMLGALYATYLH